MAAVWAWPYADISIHAPPRGATRITPYRCSCASLFQSTPPARGGDSYPVHTELAVSDFNPRPPRGGRLRRENCELHHTVISIHAPREGGDMVPALSGTVVKISIHAPREGGDRLHWPA